MDEDNGNKHVCIRKGTHSQLVQIKARIEEIRGVETDLIDVLDFLVSEHWRLMMNEKIAKKGYVPPIENTVYFEYFGR